MSEITKSTVEKIAQLANIRLQKEEAESYAGQLEKVLEYIHKLNELDTTGVEQTGHVMPIHNIWRKDKVQSGLNQEQALENAPDPEDGCFRVPRIIE